MTTKAVNISSLDQLTTDEDKELELLVQTASRDSDNGCTLNSLFTLLRERVVSLSGDCSLLHTAIAQKGLNVANLKDYDHFRFRFHHAKFFNVLAEGFPRLTTCLQPAITSARYTISLSSIESFIVSQKDF